MKQAINILMMATAIIFTTAFTPAGNAYTLSKGYKVTIHGTSNLHDWNETVVAVTGNGTIDWNTDGSFNLEAMSMSMGVHSIKSTEGSMMNNNTYKALKADSYPNITFVLLAPVRSIPASAAGRSIAAKVNLSIAGVTRAVDITITATGQGHGSVTFEGSKTIRMTDYGIKPPVALLGTLKTGNEITIHFITAFAANN